MRSHRTSSQRPFAAAGARIGGVIIGLCILVPIMLTFAVATSTSFSRGVWGDGFTWQWLIMGWYDLRPMVGRSLAVASVVTVVNLIVGGGLSYWVARRPGMMSRWIRHLMNLPMAVPGIALSIGLISLYPDLRPSGVLLTFGHLLLTLPFVVGALVPAFADPAIMECEQVATTLGSGALGTFLTITLPSIKVAAVQAMMMTFAISFGEFNVSFFVNPPATSMVPFALFDAYSTQRIEIGSAYTIVFILVLVPVLTLFLILRSRFTTQKGTKR